MKGSSRKIFLVGAMPSFLVPYATPVCCEYQGCPCRLRAVPDRGVRLMRQEFRFDFLPYSCCLFPPHNIADVEFFFTSIDLHYPSRLCVDVGVACVGPHCLLSVLACAAQRPAESGGIKAAIRVLRTGL